jgi:nucleoside-diphosphate-sugar epimerase
VRRALVTGHRGFIGRHIHATLLDLGWEVMGIDLADGVDAVDGRVTPLQWAVAAYQEIGRQTGKGPEVAFQEVVGEVHALGAFMPDGEPWMQP